MQLKYRLKQRNACRCCGGTIPFPSPAGLYCSEACRKLGTATKNKRYFDRMKSRVAKHKESRGCSRCGYNKCGAALDWHHTNDNKERRITTKSYFSPLGIAERKKCILLCANCHREEHCE